MPGPAAVHSIEALEQFRTALILFREKTSASLHEIAHEVARTRSWVQSERLPFWKAEIHRVQRALDDAQQRLFSAELSDFRDTPSEEQRQVRRLREQQRAAEEKLGITETWARQYDVSLMPLAKSAERLRSLVEDLSQPIHSLAEMIKDLEAYAELSRSGLSRTTGSGPEENPAGAKPDPAAP